MRPPASTINGHILDAMATSTEIHARLTRPVIDIDGHMAEHFPTLAPYFEAEGLSFDHPSLRQLLPTYGGTDASWYEQTPEERAATNDLVERLMGRRPELRFQFIQDRARTVEEVDV